MNRLCAQFCLLSIVKSSYLGECDLPLARIEVLSLYKRCCHVTGLLLSPLSQNSLGEWIGWTLSCLSSCFWDPDSRRLRSQYLYFENTPRVVGSPRRSLMCWMDSLCCKNDNILFLFRLVSWLEATEPVTWFFLEGNQHVCTSTADEATWMIPETFGSHRVWNRQ